MNRWRSNPPFVDPRPSFRSRPLRWGAATLVSILLAGTAGCTTHLGASEQAASTVPPTTVGALSLDTPIEQICARPDGKAVMDRDLPGLTSRPEFGVFKSMSLRTLAAMSNGKLPADKLAQVGVDLARLSPGRR